MPIMPSGVFKDRGELESRLRTLEGVSELIRHSCKSGGVAPEQATLIGGESASKVLADYAREIDEIRSALK
jgi:hypothetical protein